MDTRSGGNGVQLGDRKLRAAEMITTKSHLGESPFNTTRRFTKMMCDKARMAAQPVYGINSKKWCPSFCICSARCDRNSTKGGDKGMLPAGLSKFTNRRAFGLDAECFSQKIEVKWRSG